jgi:hypothetical protein
LIVAIAAALAGIGGGAALIGAGRTRAKNAEAGASRALETRILALAAKRNGDLTAADVATAFRITPAVAEAALMRMSDGSKITAEVDESVGMLHFEFHDLVPAPPKTRVEVEAADEAEVEAEREKREREVER